MKIYPVLLLLFALPLSGCAVVGIAATATSTAVSIGVTGIELGASGVKTIATTTSDIVTAPKKTDPPN